MKTYFKLIGLSLGIFLMLSCEKGGSERNKEYGVAQEQLVKDYPNYDLSNVKWTTERDYQVARFNIETKTSASTTPSMSAWYSITGDKATREMDTESLGTSIPNIIKTAFRDTIYSNTQLWTIDEIELENRYNGNGIEQVYEMALDSKTISNLEAELYFDAKTGKLLFVKESFDDNDNDDGDDKFVINPQLFNAVQKAHPGAHILDAEIDDNQIEVEAIDTLNNMHKKIELLFSMEYALLESEIEYETTYGKLPKEFKAINALFTDLGLPIPATTEVEITEGGDIIYKCKYIVKIKYEVEQIENPYIFYLDAEYAIVSMEPTICPE